MTTRDCGLACLVMILRHHGADASLSACHRDAPLGRDGTTLRALAIAAQTHGLEPRAFTASPDALTQLPLPLIAHWEDDHYVVIEAASARHVRIVDPALGRRLLDWREVHDGLTGTVLALVPGARFRRAPRAPGRRLRALRSSLAPVVASLPGARVTLVKVMGASLVIQMLGLVPPVLMATVVDDVVPAARHDVLAIVGLGAVGLVASHLVTSTMRAILLIRLQANVDRRLGERVLTRLLALPFAFFQQRPGGDLMQRMTSIAMLRELLTSQAIAAVLDGGLVIVYLAVLLVADPVLGGAVIAVGAVELVLLILLQGRSRRLHQRHLRAQGQAQALLFETLDGIATVKAAGAEQRIFESWSRRNADAVDVGTRQRLLDAHLETATSALQLLAPLMVLCVGAQRVIGGSLSLGTMMALQALALAFLVPLGSLVASARQLQAAGAHLERLRDILEAAPEERAARRAPRLRGAIELRGVSFTHAGSATPALRDVSLTIAAGQKVAVVGRSGSGKTTLALLLLGFHVPDAGQILYDGFPGTELDPHVLRRQIGTVLQEPFLFGDSIHRNIAATDPALSTDAVEAAARIAAIHDDVAAMPMGYETRLAAGGGGLSGGERQRLAIARAVAHRPSVLLIDEGTSHLDVVTEQRVADNLDRLGCTRIVIAHRLSTVSAADQIVVMDDGAVLERGRHKELLALGGHYAALVRGQVATPVEGDGIPGPSVAAA